MSAATILSENPTTSTYATVPLCSVHKVHGDALPFDKVDGSVVADIEELMLLQSSAIGNDARANNVRSLIAFADAPLATGRASEVEVDDLMLTLPADDYDCMLGLGTTWQLIDDCKPSNCAIQQHNTNKPPRVRRQRRPVQYSHPMVNLASIQGWELGEDDTHCDERNA